MNYIDITRKSFSYLRDEALNTILYIGTIQTIPEGT